MTEEEFVLEDDAELGDIAAATAKVKSLRTDLKEALSKRDEYLAGWQRCKADSVNARKDMAQNVDRAVTREKESFIEDILVVLDSFDMASSSTSWEEVNPEWRMGVTHIHNQLLDVLAKHGVNRFGKEGEKYDHALHEAVQEIEDGQSESGLLVKVLRHGYKSADRIIRPAHVIVRK